VGKFVPGQRIEDPSETQDVVLGIGKKVYCPEHTYSYPVRYMWAYKSNRRPPKLIPENRSMMLLSDGRVLFLSMVTRALVNEINGKGGVTCMLYVNRKGMLSRRIKLRITGEGKLRFY